MPDRRKSYRPGLVNERLMALFVLGVVMITPPFIGVFNKPVMVLNVPLLYVYLFAAWVLLIVLMALAIERTEDQTGDAATTASKEPRDDAGEL